MMSDQTWVSCLKSWAVVQNPSGAGAATFHFLEHPDLVSQDPVIAFSNHPLVRFPKVSA